MDIHKFIAKRVFEFDMGRHFSSIVQFLLLISIFVKLNFNVGVSGYIILSVVATIGVWLLGFLVVKTGFMEKYQLESPIFKKLFKEIGATKSLGGKE